MADSDPERPDLATELVAGGVSSLPGDQWDACAGSGNPFMTHDFLSIMEESGSVGEDTGWRPAPIIIRAADGRIDAALPAYLKGHSQGEYVFDHAWADAFERAGGRYYPKLQIASPFSPVPGPRLLLRNPALAPALLSAAESLVRVNGLSSAHATFVAPEQVPLFESFGWLIRIGNQFHWQNRGYQDFDDFLGALASRKRKAIRRERRQAQDAVSISRLTGADIQPRHWDAFWQFYIDTGARKWGRPYLTRKAFTLMGERMADRILLVMAELEGQPIAGALNLIGADTLYGRYWGALADIPCLHFELCYYQAIEAAIEMGLGTVEAGAQGEHKLARGYEPTPTYSAHFIADTDFRTAVSDYLKRERAAIRRDIAFLGEMGPFRRSG